MQRENLAVYLQLLTNAQKGEGGIQEIYKYRTCICRMVETFFTDLKKVEESCGNEDGMSDCLLLLQLIVNCLDTKSDTFHYSPRIMATSTPGLSTVKNKDISLEAKLSRGFCLWLMGRIIRLLGLANCSSLQERCNSNLIHLLQTIKLKDCCLYRELLGEMVLAIAELVKISDKLYATGEPQCLKRFFVKNSMIHQSLHDPSEDVGELEFELSDVYIDVTDVDYCERIQLNLTKILLPLAKCINQFDVMKTNIVWSCMCWHLEFGDVELKVTSVNVCIDLLEELGLPPPEILDYLLACVHGLIELVMSGCQNLEKQEIYLLENKAADLIKQIIIQDSKTHLTFHMTQRHHQQMLMKLSEIFNQYGLVNLQDAAFKQSLSRLLCYCLDILPENLIIGKILAPAVDGIMNCLVSTLGATYDFQFVVPVLSILVYQQLTRCNNTKIESDKDTDNESSKKLSLHSAKKKRKKSPDDESSSIGRITELYRNLVDRLIILLNSSEMPCLETLEACYIVIEVAVRSSADLRNNNKSDVVCEMLNPDLLTNIINYWSNYLKLTIEDISLPDINKSLIIVTDSIGALISLEYNLMDNKILQELTWMLSLPWLANDPKWLDLRPSRPKDVANISYTLSEKLDENVTCRCLSILTLLPKEVASQWRIHVFQQAMSERGSKIHFAAIRGLPMLIQTLGANSTHLIQDLLHPQLNFKEAEIQACIVYCLKYLPCIIARTTSRICEKYRQSCLPFYEHSTIQCSICSLQGSDGIHKDYSEKNKPIDITIFSPFMQLESTLLSTNSAIKIDFVSSLKFLFNHMDTACQSKTYLAMLRRCLNLTQDTAYFVRREFSEVICYLVDKSKQPDTDNPSEINKLIVKHLKDVLLKAKSDNNILVMETVMITIGHFGRVTENDLLLMILKYLLESILSPIPQISSVAYLQLQEIAKHKKCTPQNLFRRYKGDICKFLVEALHTAQMTEGGNAEQILNKVSEALGFQDIKTCLQDCEKYMLPILVSKATPEASSIIKLLATSLTTANRKMMMIHNAKYIFSHIVRFCQDSDMEKVIAYFQSETNFDLGSLLRMDFQRAHNVLLLHLGTNYKEVFVGLKMLSDYDEQYTGPPIVTQEQMADYLEPRLLGVLAYLDFKLMNPYFIIQDKRLALESLTAIIRLMGPKHISSIRYKVLNTLRLGLQFKDKTFVENSCRAWNCFIRSLDLNLLGQMLSLITATLLPLIEQLPRQMADIFNYMIVENRKILHTHFNEVYFVLDIPELMEVNAVLKQYTEGPSSQSDLKTKLEHSLKGIAHESLDVRCHALTKLRKLVQEEKDVLYEYVMGSETADPIISQLLSVLLSGCRDSDPKLQMLYAQCLGEVGAIDQGRLDLMTNNPKEEMAKFQASIDDDNFAVELINKIVKAFLEATEPKFQDCSAFALQELIQEYEIAVQKETEISPGKLWKRFPVHVQEILNPLLNSKYRLNTGAGWSNLPKPIYRSVKGNNFKEWVSNWTGYLISKVKQPKAFRVFQTCSATIKYHIHVALYILPHVTVQVLQDGVQEDVNEVFAEIMEVLTQVKKPDTRHGSASDFRHMSAQTVFSVIDYLTKWRRHRAQTKAAEKPNPKEAAYLKDPGYQAVDNFLERIPQDELAEACFNCKAFTRGLMHFEQYLSSTDQNLQDHLGFMQRLYVSMDEQDGVLGVAAVCQKKPTLIQEIRTHESLGQQQDAQACYERAVQLEPDEVRHHQGLLRSLMELSQHNKALLHATGVIAERPNWTQQLNAYRVEAAWKLGSWDKLETFKKMERHSRNWPVGVGRILLAAKHRNEEEFCQQLQIVRKEQMGPLSAASMETGSYHRGYENIVGLHILNEIEESMKVLFDFPVTNDDNSEPSCRKSQASLLSQWESRLLTTQSSFRTQEPILTLRRTLFSLVDVDRPANIDTQIGAWWLRSAKVARKAGYFQTAYSCLLHAGEFNLPEFALEKAKWLWEKGDNDAALTCLEKGINEHFSNIINLKSDVSDEGKAKRAVYAKVLLLYGRYSEETSSMESNAIVKRYKDVIDILPNWEDGHFYLANYYDKIMTTLIDDKDRPDKQGEFIIHVVKYFGQSLQYGSQYIYQSMPRLLSLWLDYGTTVVEAERKERGKSQHKIQAHNVILSRLNKTMEGLIRQLAEYQFFTAFPQLISRICHAHPDVFKQLQDIIAKLLVSFPKQAIWMLMSVSKSSYPMRVKRCKEIFATARAASPDLHKFIQDATKLTERLLELSETNFGNAATLSITQHFRPLQRLLEDSDFSPMILPLQSAMTVTLPSGPVNSTLHRPFPDRLVYIKGFEDTIEVLASLQKPKKITMIGSDGKRYVMMCKPKDDLRKDCRLMEFNTIINKFLRKDPESRRRNLHIRTYTVVPLNEECGLLEWVNNTSGLRYILMKLYKEKGLYTTGKELKAMMPSLHSSIDTKLQIFKTKFLPKHPPVFKEWFLRTFPDPTSWYNARLAYARTSAVMSVVGYILGLGDRHGENILFDSKTGDTVHVDFNCLFNKGETFEWAEKVPFRLTPNMIDVLGPMGVEGIFRRACEVSLRVMRDQMDTLMSVLRPFIYDPLVEWSKPSRGQRSNPTDTGEISNEQAMNHVQNIEHRLKGILKNKTKPRGLPLSIEGHVNHLIQEATDEKNLCQMYIGWAPYL
ncbi:hypothetical protein SNE40_004864 [Patella caerulea]|uniref:Serine/threonine-protein kinase ATR n=2 Tax=Patella TaxID=6463 RepID=A0AAN8KA89_PATCE